MPLAIAASDLNGDGLFDLIISHHLELQDKVNLNIFLNRRNGGWFRRENYAFLYPADHILSVANGDFDCDIDNRMFKKYLSFCTIDGNLHTIYLDHYSPVRAWRLSTKPLYANTSILVKGKFNDDELDDLALLFPHSDTLQILFSNYDETVPKFIQQTYFTHSYPTSVTRINFNNDTIDDLAILSCNGTVIVFLGTKIGIFHRHYLSFEMSTHSRRIKCSHSLKADDLNQDGRDDLIFIDPEMNSITVLLGAPCNE